MESPYAKKLAELFEVLRKSRGVTQEDFVHDVVSLRQYRRYLRGDSIMSYPVMVELSKRLSLTAKHVIEQLDKERLVEAKKVDNFYNALVTNDFEKARKLGDELFLDELYDDDNRLLYLHTLDLFKFLEKRISKSEHLEHTLKLINYPSILSKSIITPIEVLVLGALLRLHTPEERKKIARFIDDLSQNDAFLYGYSNYHTVVLSMFALARYYGFNGEYQKVLRVCDTSIEICDRYKLLYLLPNFYYYRALAYDFLDKDNLRDQALFQLFSALYTENKPQRVKLFSKLLKKDFDIDFQAWVLEYMQNQFKLKGDFL